MVEQNDNGAGYSGHRVSSGIASLGAVSRWVVDILTAAASSGVGGFIGGSLLLVICSVHYRTTPKALDYYGTWLCVCLGFFAGFLAGFLVRSLTGSISRYWVWAAG